MKEIRLDSLVWVHSGNYSVTATVIGRKVYEGEIMAYRVRIKGDSFNVRPNQVTAIR